MDLTHTPKKLAPISLIAACSLFYQISFFPPTPPKKVLS